MNQVFKFLSENISLNNNDNVVIALSGGPDSMVLLNILMQLRKNNKFNIICAHVNHNLREESASEEEFVRNYCITNNIVFEFTRFEYETKFNESIGHKKRYDYFDKIIKKYNAKYLFTAHHGDDLIESVLMRIVRGSSMPGYIGFDKIVECDNYKILRPLVYVTKDEILEYAKRNNIPYVIDKSNEDEKYTRNRYRKNILPVLKKENKNVHLKFLQYNELLSENVSFIEECVNKEYDSIVTNNKINIQKIKNKNIVIIRQIIYKWLYTFYKDDINTITMKHINSIIEMINNNKPNMIINIPNHIVKKEYDYIFISITELYDDYKYLLDDKVYIDNNCIEIIEDSNKTDNYVTYLNSKDIKFPLYVRNYKSGDYMEIKNLNGHKKIKDIFINEKVSISDRKKYPIVVDSNDTIIWLPGLKKSSFDSQKEGKYDIILEYRLGKESI